MKLTPSSMPEVFGNWAYLAIEKHFQKTLKHESDVLNDTDPEALHQMRVGMRRLRTAIKSFAPAIVMPKPIQDKNIAKIARQLGKLRDLDVLQETLETQYLPALPASEQKTLNKGLITLQKDRKACLKQVRKTLHQERYQSLKQALKDWLDQPTYGAFAELKIQDILPDLLLPLVSQLLLHPAWLVGVNVQAGTIDLKKDLTQNDVVELLNTQGDLLHSLRKQAKGVRYQMELFIDFYSSTYQDYVTDIKSIQQILGHIQDSVVLAEFLNQRLKVDLTAKLPTLAEQLSTNRYQSWQEWRDLQDKFLHPLTREKLHQLILQPIIKE